MPLAKVVTQRQFLKAIGLAAAGTGAATLVVPPAPAHAATWTESGSTLTVTGMKVGIGTTSPEVALQVHDGHVYLTTSGSSVTLWFANGYSASTNWAGLGMVGDGSLRLTGTGSLGSPSVVITNDNFVGIGTTSPLVELHAAQRALIGPVPNYTPPAFQPLTARATNNGGQVVLVIANTGSLVGTAASLLFGHGVNDATLAKIRGHLDAPGSGSLRFDVVEGSSHRPDVMVITPNGRVGIGLTGPSERLEVGGKVKATAFLAGTRTVADAAGVYYAD